MVKYKSKIEEIVHRGLQCFGEDVRIEQCFKHMSIRRAFALFIAKGIPKIVTEHLCMSGFQSVELFGLMIKFMDMAVADNRFSGRAEDPPSMINIVGLIQTQLIMGMVAPRMTFVIDYLVDHIDEINDYGPRTKSVIEEQEEYDQLQAATQLRFNTYAANTTILYRNGLSTNAFLYNVEISFLDEMEHMLIALEPNVPQPNGVRIFKGLPRLWEGLPYDVINDYCRQAYW